MEDSLRSSSSTVDISPDGIVDQEGEKDALEVCLSHSRDSSDSAERRQEGHRSENNISRLSDHSTNSYEVRGGNKTIKMILLTQCLAGLQFSWSVELAYGTPYLLDLGLSKSLMSLVWLAGPLSEGLVMQPIVGAFSDRSTSKYGRRRPYLVGGSIMVMATFISIGWTKEIVGLFFGTGTDSSKYMSMWFAVFSFYALDFSINAVMAACRALITDSLPKLQQEAGNAWAGRMVGVGSVVGYFMGFVNLKDYFPFLGNTQLKVLCILACIVLVICNVITCWAVPERPLVGGGGSTRSAWESTIDTFYSITRLFRKLPRQVKNVCYVQFASWMGWFPFLFYSTTWVSEIFVRNSQNGTGSNLDGTQAGSFSLLLFSLVSLFASFVLPLLVAPSDIGTPPREFSMKQLLRLPLPFLTLSRLWTISHFIFAFAMISTWWVGNVFQADLIISLIGISWSISMWAPFSLLGEYIKGKDAVVFRDEGDDGQIYSLVESRADREVEGREYNGLEGEDDHNVLLSDANDDISVSSVSSGIILGIHNMFVVFPQFFATFFSSIVFAILEPVNENKTDGGDVETDSIGFVLRCGGLMSIVAGYLCVRYYIIRK
ncbi:8969_t:CDS:2 [Acaulospora morrowiae]|uniref:8969_t:CDS:1 n=1 Tax=Acaulospora morrowiae TaxID=94023 RepID=A0A9N9H7F4_9GLOM|nr:8969_t:CDS:2 [Acaulospora morrowiae]